MLEKYNSFCKEMKKKNKIYSIDYELAKLKSYFTNYTFNYNSFNNNYGFLFEKLFEDLLKSKKIKYEKQKTFKINKEWRVVDFYLPDHKIVYELKSKSFLSRGHITITDYITVTMAAFSIINNIDKEINYCVVCCCALEYIYFKKLKNMAELMKKVLKDSDKFNVKTFSQVVNEIINNEIES